MKKIILALYLVIFSIPSFASTPTYKDSLKSEVQSYIDVIKPLVEQVTNSNKIAGLPENVVYGILSIIIVAIIMYFHRKKIAEQNAAHQKNMSEIVNSAKK